ncbi:MAG: DNA internalization-related competence protein ComEC/Rec2 [Deltaproteobacteria bacterium]|nr:DNA internalization-related competence protein ComEC/Rec2 [Deltaproteobacteria bacterium]
MFAVHRPLFYLLISLCFGIAAGRHLPVDPLILAILAIFLCALLCFLTVRGLRLLLLPLTVFVVMGALASTTIPDPEQPPATIQHLLQKKSVFLMGIISQPLEHRPSSSRILLRLEAVREGESWHRASGNLLLTVRNCEKQWLVGQRLIGRVRIKPIRNLNNPGGFNYRQYLADQRIWVRGYVRQDAELVPVGKPDRGLSYFLDIIRTRSRVFLKAWLPPDIAGLYQALLLGERYGLSGDLREQLYNVGIGHLLAISGLHLGLVAGFAFLIFHFFLRRIVAVAGRWGARPVAALAAFPLALTYGLLTGMGLPALRATLMLAFFTLALVVQREKDLLNSLLLAGFLILSFHPEALFSASFQLSFIGVIALVWILPMLPVVRILQPQDGQDQRLRRLGYRLYQFICASLILSLFTAPVVLYHFHRLTPVGMITNLFAVPLVGFVVLPAGLLALCFLPVSTLLAGFFLTLGTLGLKLVVLLAAKFGSLSWATFWPGTPKVWQVGLAYILLLVPFTKTSRWLRTSIITVCFIALVGPWFMPHLIHSAQSDLRVTYLDVGQGNSAVVELPEQGAMLIDGGGFSGGSFDVGQHVVAPYLWHRGIRRLDAVVLSHAHPDHFKGLSFVIKHFPTKQFWTPQVSTHDPDFVDLMNRLAEKKVACLGPQELPTRQNIKGVMVQILHPPPNFHPGHKIPTNRELNNLSLVVRLNYKEVSFLFPGDIEKEVEYRLVNQSFCEPVDVLLVPHHGSRTSSSFRFLHWLQPRIAIFSVGFDNPFHLPARRVWDRYNALGTRTYRTDYHGAVTILSDGHNIEVETFVD